MGYVFFIEEVNVLDVFVVEDEIVDVVVVDFVGFVDDVVVWFVEVGFDKMFLFIIWKCEVV